MTLKVAIDAMRADAGEWRDTADKLSQAKLAASGLELNASQLSWIGEETGVVATYAAVRIKVAQLLGEGATTISALSTTLSNLATEFETDDAAAAQRLDGVWEVKE